MAFIIYTTEFSRSFSFQILKFDTAIDFYLFIFNEFTSEPFWTSWCQPSGEKKIEQDILGRVRRQSTLLMEISYY